MPSFEYTAIDRQGHSVSGQVQAANRDEAALNLTRTGLLVSRLEQASSGVGSPPSQILQRPLPGSAASGPAQSAIRQNAPPVLRPQTQSRPQPRPIHTSLAPIRTKRGSDKDIYFIFSQLSAFASSGQNPVEALTHVARNTRRADYAEALQSSADAAKEGRRISDVFGRYIDLFPPNVVGMVRASEEGGFQPEAYEIIVDQAHASHKIRKWFVWLLAVAIMVAGCMPIFVLFIRGALDSWDAQEKAGGNAPGFATLWGQVGHQLLWPIGPVTLLLIGAIWLFSRWWQSLPNRELRHRMVLMVPTVNKRARAESLAVFGWSMGMLAKLGLPPKTVWDLASGTVPNLAIRHQLEDTGSRMTEQTKLSDAMAMSRTLPEEYAPIVSTGEITGDIPTAISHASAGQLDEFKQKDVATRMQIGCWMLLFIFIGSAIMFGVFYGNFYPNLFKKILGE